MIADIITILRSGLFMHSAYANRYLGRRFHLWLSLAHYLFVGEQRGNRPNPFYDPTAVRSRGIERLGIFLRTPALWAIPTTDVFDPAFYRETGMQGTGGNPLVHFWRYGFDAERSPSRDFDLRFFKHAVEFYRPDKKEYAFELLAGTDRFVPGTEAALRQKAETFYASINFVVVRRLAAARRRFLVVIQADRSFLNPFADPIRSFDVLVNDYSAGPPSAGLADYDPHFDYVTTQRGTKTTAIRKLLADATDIVLAYDYVLFLDDDVAMTSEAVDQLFATVAAHQLDLAQASLTARSFCAFDILKQPVAGTGLTPLTTVEIMMPILSRRALRACGWVFAEGLSGWAVDFLLGVEIRKRFGNRIALVGDVVARHERDIDTQDGAFYRFLRGHGIDAGIEAGRIALHFGIEVSTEAIRRHADPLDGPL